MAFINKDNLVLIEGKITNIGRQQLAYGTLSFSNFAVGDSEIDYRFADIFSLDSSQQKILRPVDSQPNIRYPVLLSNTSTEYLSKIPNLFANERLIRNKAKERGFFSRVPVTPATVPATLTPYRVNTTPTSGLVAGSAKIVSTSNAEPSSIIIDDISKVKEGSMLLIQWFPPNLSASQRSSHSDADNIAANTPTAWLWYKVALVKSGNKSLDLDREIPKHNASLGGNVYIYPPLGNQITNYENGVTSPYWDPETLVFNNPASTNTSDVPVWNLSIIYADSVAGSSSQFLANTYPSATYNGFRSYVGANTLFKPVGVLHYTNHTNNNYYGEGLFESTLVVELPTVMYHNSQTRSLGLTLTTDSIKRSLVSENSASTSFSLTYYNLVTPDLKVVGKVFCDLKIILIEDCEILAVMTYASNRNWTLPGFAQFSINVSRPANVELANNSNNTTIYVTYMLGNAPSAQGYRNSMISQVYSSASGNGINGAQLSFRESDFKFLSNSTDGTGFSATDFTILFQIVNTGGTLKHNKWLPIPFNEKIGITTAGTQITPAMLSRSIMSFNATDIQNAISAGIFYSLDYLRPNPSLTFGAEELFYGNIKTDIKAVAFATTFRLQLDSGRYDKSTNPTWNPTLPVYISEVGIYDNNNNLVVSGKLNYPLKKDSDEIVLISLDMDF